MSKIIINEIDKTTAGLNTYNNFSVVVPGFVNVSMVTEREIGKLYKRNNCYYYANSANIADDVLVFDENGIYECNSQADFVKYIGKKAGVSETVESSVDIHNFGTDSAPVYQGQISLAEFNNYKSKIYFPVGYSSGTTKPEITNIVELNAGIIWIPANNVVLNKIVDPATLVVSDLSESDIKWYKVQPAVDYNANIQAAYIMLVSNTRVIGSSDTISQNGNQIAYELLGLGYTVLYKLINAVATELDASTYWECLKDKSTYDFRYITTGGYNTSSAYKCINDIAYFQNQNGKDLNQVDLTETGRGDCIALLDLDETNWKADTIIRDIKNSITALSNPDSESLTKYSAAFAPKVIYEGVEDDTYRNLTFPASFHYLACAAYAQERGYKEWYAVAGYTRGIGRKVIAGTTFKLGDIAVNALQPRISSSDLSHSVNLVIKDRTGYYLWGNRTGHTLDQEGLVASHFLNIRQLCCSLKKELYFACRNFTFDPNSDILWVNFVNTITPVLEGMKADQGINDYRIIKVKSTKKAVLTAKIRIVPIEAVEDFWIDLYLEDSVSGTTIAVDESSAE